MPDYHIPVLLKKSVDFLEIKESGVYVDATFGGGGHSREILSRLGKNGRLIAFDQDSDAIANAPKDERLILVHNNFRFIHNFVLYYGFEGVDGILADLGVSSHQFDTGERGFSFRFDAPLDMRMNQLGEVSAESIVNNYSQEDLEKILRNYGEVEKSRFIADLICKGRVDNPIKTTEDLARVIERALPKFAEHKFLAKIYQALRIEVNGEMDALAAFLDGAMRSLKVGGRISAITYHSLEDRMVKNFLKSGNILGDIKKDFYGKSQAPFELITRKPLLPEEEEISRNSRARSAKLRVAEKL